MTKNNARAVEFIRSLVVNNPKITAFEIMEACVENGFGEVLSSTIYVTKSNTLATLRLLESYITTQGFSAPKVAKLLD